MARRLAIRNGQGGAPIGPALVGIAFFGFSSGLMEKVSDTMCYLLCALSGMALQAIPGMISTTLQWLASGALEYGGLLFCAHLLANVAPLLRCAAGAI